MIFFCSNKEQGCVQDRKAKQIPEYNNINQIIIPIKDVMNEVSCEEEKLIKALRTDTVLSNDSLPEVITSSMTETDQMKFEQSFNASNVVNTNNNNNNPNDIDINLNQPQLPQKPNHTPIYVVPKDEKSPFHARDFRLSTTRFSSRHEFSKLDEKRFELKSIPSPIRPFLSRGSVAERVLIFEKCPEKASTRQTTNQEKPKILVSVLIFFKMMKLNLNNLLFIDKTSEQNFPSSTFNTSTTFTKVNKFYYSTVRRIFRCSFRISINLFYRFYYPYGKPPPSITIETTIQRLEIAFSQFQNYEIPREKFHLIVTICQVPLYWRVPLFMSTQLTRSGCVNGNRFIDFWRQ